MDTLEVGVNGSWWRVAPAETLTFGRSGDVVLDADNRHLHRVLGCFAATDERWFLQNLGRFTTLLVTGRDGCSRREIGPGDQAPLPLGAFDVAFEAGPRFYSISGRYSAGPCTS